MKDRQVVLILKLLLNLKIPRLFKNCLTKDDWKNAENCEKYCICNNKMRSRSNAKYLRFECRLSFSNTVQNGKNTGRGKSWGIKGEA